MNGRDDSAEAVDQEVAAQHRGRAERPEPHAAQRERDQRDDHERVEDDGGEDRRLRGLSRSMTLSWSSAGITPANIAGMMAKYLATSLAIENVVSAPR